MQTTTDSPKTMPAPSVGSGELLAGSTGDTPRTDDECMNNFAVIEGRVFVRDYFARELERENARMRAAGQNLRDYLEATPVAGFDIPDDIYKPFIDALANVKDEPRP